MSKTDHPRIPGTHRVGHAPRSWQEMGKGDVIDYGTPKRVVRALLATTEPAEVLAEPKRRCKFCGAEIQELAEWEQVLMAEEYGSVEEDPAYDFCGYACLRDHDMFADEGYAWESTEDVEHELDLDPYDTDDVSAALRHGTVPAHPDSTDTRMEPWMPIVSIEECRDIFGGSDFTISHANVVRTGAARKPAGRW
jgi:hypothetical protein